MIIKLFYTQSLHYYCIYTELLLLLCCVSVVWLVRLWPVGPKVGVGRRILYVFIYLFVVLQWGDGGDPWFNPWSETTVLSGGRRWNHNRPGSDVFITCSWHVVGTSNSQSEKYIIDHQGAVIPRVRLLCWMWWRRKCWIYRDDSTSPPREQKPAF